MSSVPGPALASGLPLLAGVPVTHAFLQARDLEVKHYLCARLLPYPPLSLLNLGPLASTLSLAGPPSYHPVSLLELPQFPSVPVPSPTPQSSPGLDLCSLYAQDPMPPYCPQNTDPSHVCSSMLRCHCHLFLPAPALQALASGSPSLFKIRFRAEVTHSQKH